jgi:hypothetical protein
MLEPRFEQTPDEDARMLTVGRPDRHRVHELFEQRREIGDLQPPRARAATPAQPT